MLTHSLMTQLDHGHLIAAVHCEIDALASTDLERELLARLEAALDAHDGALVQTAEAYDFAAEDIKALGDALIENTSVTVALLNVLGATGMHDPDRLRAQLTLTSSTPLPMMPETSSHASPN